jgi:AcrR family transcriptional regulator
MTRSQAGAGRAAGTATRLAPGRRERTRNALVAAATDVFLERGYDGATTGEIARQAGVAAGTFYLHFEDKRDIFGAVSGQVGRELLAQLRELASPGMAGSDLVRITLEMVTEHWRSNRELTRLILSGGPALGMADENAFVDEVRQVIEEIGTRRGTEAMALALYLVGLSQQLGHLIVARPEARAEVEALIALSADRLDSTT